MKKRNLLVIAIMAIAMVFNSCNSTQKGAGIGAIAGGVIGAIIGKAAGDTAAGAVIGAAVGGTAGAIIGHQMDKAAKEIEEEIPGVNVDRVGEGIIVEFSNDILFEINRFDLSNEAKENLDKLAIILERYPDTDVEIHGHTDITGRRAYNQTLSENRARAVAEYLVYKGIAAPRLAIIGFGPDQPKYSNDTPEGRVKNRRVEFAITANEEMRQKAEQEAAGN
jgi:outer membrane protein OmpA-like peptidoglycan-associated protein